jgi:hypothetical protein
MFNVLLQCRCNLLEAFGYTRLLDPLVHFRP